MRRERWYIRILQRCPYNGRYDRDDWRAYRKVSAWPITFATIFEGEQFMRHCFTFKNLKGRKISASLCRCGSDL